MTKAAVLKQKVFRYIKDKIRAKTPTMRQCQITISETRKKESSSQAELEFGLNKRAEFEQKEDINNSLLKKKIFNIVFPDLSEVTEVISSASISCYLGLLDKLQSKSMC